MSYSPIFEKALRFAAIAHKNQSRKNSDLPYIYHPFAVSTILHHFKYPLEWRVAALLHDTIEDTDKTATDIEQNFGRHIMDLVIGCSEPEHNNASWEDRKKHTINFLTTADLPVKIIACADKIHNLHSILYDHNIAGDKVWLRFNRGKQAQKWYHENLLTSLFLNVKNPQNHKIFTEYETLISQIFK